MCSDNVRPRRSSLDNETLAAFERDYEFIVANSDAQKQRVYALRHEVFLQEFHYAMHEDSSHHLEQDEYDPSAIHCLIRHRASGLSAGCMRLVMPSDDAASRFHHLPVEIQGGEYFDHPEIDPRALPRARVCEVSRLAIARPFRSASGKDDPLPQHATDYVFSAQESRTFPLLAIGLFLITYSLVGLTGRRHVFAMMEPRLPRLLALSGFHFTRVSQAIEFHGTRHAYYIDHQQAEQDMHADLMPLYLDIKRRLAAQLPEALTQPASTPCY
ncbi:PEP-CTERM/exosortase system-associated acyltransferase [Halomonas borealis]|jgi:N-acyl amino acid synthase of PEP-CTERM/exosortase system|uniref:PEP-CTERM/exosortase system-associated acyltransferase n=1 Tax=Halomonas borealis TaxID=2508710 RepID=UPI001445B95F|nr:PEP-CTERM/exosortase system-associated acyltransferase [Halomonas borealis]